jgi:hypothetical protein
MGRQIVEHRANAFGARVMHVDEFAHARGEVRRDAPLVRHQNRRYLQFGRQISDRIERGCWPNYLLSLHGDS